MNLCIDPPLLISFADFYLKLIKLSIHYLLTSQNLADDVHTSARFDQFSNH